ncbi:MAG: glycosyltransferase family 2 protein [Lachnospiraceae bacterium]|jgi:glycosyltransferase involved in cell wall biosynthesis|nr:glycosyltransferase family 2 protein [Lachnospiraceae bacterium]
MGKRICAVAMVKNESDIIESFIRHTLTFCDQMLILEDRSDDNTLEIIDKLIAEGLPIVVFTNQETFGYYQSNITTKLANLAIERYGADLVLPLDADEFLFAPHGNEPRDILEQCEGAEMYLVFQKNAMPQQLRLEGNLFVPAYFTDYIVQDISGCKCFVERDVLEKEGATIVTGNHMILLPDRKPKALQFGEALVLAHYPVRSAEQAMTKAIVGWSNSLCTYDEFVFKKPILFDMLAKGERFTSYHWFQMYELVKSKGHLDLADLQELAVICAQMGQGEGQKPALEKLTGYHVPAIPLKYTDQAQAQKNFLNIILSNYEHIIAMWWTELKKERGLA